MKLIRFFHKLFNPNCSCGVCLTPHCMMCEVLEEQLESERAEKNRLLQTIIEVTKNIQSSPNHAEDDEDSDEKEIHPILPKHIAWNKRRAQLEKDDRAKAEQVRLQIEEIQASEKIRKDSIDNLEKELGIDDAIKVS